MLGYFYMNCDDKYIHPSAYEAYVKDYKEFVKSLSRRQRKAMSFRFTKEDTLKILGIIKEKTSFTDPEESDYSEANCFSNVARRRIAWLRDHVGESKKKYVIKDAYKDRGRARKAIKTLEEMDTHSEYDRDDRISCGYLAELLGLSIKELERLFKKYGDTSRSVAIYDDSCGIGGGHHTYVGWSTKTFTAVAFIKKILRMYDVQEVK